LVFNTSFDNTAAMLQHRVKKGRCYHWPALGCRAEFAAEFSSPLQDDCPFPISLDVERVFGDRLATHSAGDPELRIMTRVVGLSAMAGRLATLPHHSANGARPKVTETEELCKSWKRQLYMSHRSFRRFASNSQRRLYYNGHGYDHIHANSRDSDPLRSVSGSMWIAI
jgi:hypothetical protein